MTGIVLAHGGAAETVRRHLPNWQTAFDEIIFVSPEDDPLPDAQSVGKSAHRGQGSIQRMRLAVACAAARESAAILEYDTLFFTGRLFSCVIPDGIVLCSSFRCDANAPNSSYIHPYGHSPWVACGAIWQRLAHVADREEAIWPDRWLAALCRKLQIPLQGFKDSFSDDGPWSAPILERAADSVRLGALVVHGVKTPHDYEMLVEARRDLETRRRDAAAQDNDALAAGSSTPTDDIFSGALQQHQAGQLAEAERLYRRILSLKPEHDEALHHLGLIAGQVGRRDLAEQLIRKAISLRHNNSSSHHNLGEIYRNMGQLKEAITSFQRALMIDPESLHAQNNLGLALLSNGQSREAEQEFRRALCIQPSYAIAHYNLGLALAAQGRKDEAAAAFREAIRLQPDDAEARFQLEAILTDKDDPGMPSQAFRE